MQRAVARKDEQIHMLLHLRYLVARFGKSQQKQTTQFGLKTVDKRSNSRQIQYEIFIYQFSKSSN